MIIIIMVMNPEHHHLLFCQFTRTRCYLKNTITSYEEVGCILQKSVCKDDDAYPFEEQSLLLSFLNNDYNIFLTLNKEHPS